MICTEDEARKKWCPNVMVAFGPENAIWKGRGVTNRDENFEYSKCCCLGSACMLWQQIGHPENKTGCCGLGGR